MEMITLIEDNEEKFMTQGQLAELLGISTKTLEYYRWKKIGPKFIKIGRHARYRLTDVMAYIKELIDKEVDEAKQNVEQ